MAARVPVIGLDPAKIPGWAPASVQTALTRGEAGFREHGIDADLCLVVADEEPERATTAALTRGSYECVVAGGGLRQHEPLLALFETVGNLVRRHAPGAAIAFNSGPDDSVDAALRWLR